MYYIYSLRYIRTVPFEIILGTACRLIPQKYCVNLASVHRARGATSEGLQLRNRPAHHATAAADLLLLHRCSSRCWQRRQQWCGWAAAASYASCTSCRAAPQLIGTGYATPSDSVDLRFWQRAPAGSNAVLRKLKM
jgi:hypothetical protein